MKFNRIFTLLALAALSIAGCKTPDEEIGPAKLDGVPASLSFTAGGGMETVSFTATRDWTAVVSDDAKAWISVSPASGSASTTTQTASVTTLSNPGYDRTGTVTINLVSSGLTLQSVVINVTQTGDKGNNSHAGTKDDPYTASEALKIITSGTYTADEVYITGKISQISEISTQYGNATYFISDDGTSADALEVYRGYGLGGDKFKSESDIKVGDDVIVCGVLIMYSNTPEVTQGSYIYSLNGTVKEKGESGGQDGKQDDTKGTLESPYSVQMALYQAGTLDADGKIANVYVKGKISKIDEIDTGSYGNATYYISDDGTTDSQLEIYRGYYLGGAKFTSSDQIKVGDEVIVLGDLINFHGNTKEITQGSSIYSLNGQTAEPSGGDDDQAGAKDDTKGTVDSPYSVQMALYQAGTIDASGKFEGVYVKGKISKINEVSTQYGNATYFISDDGAEAKSLEIYRGYYLGGDKFTAEDQIKVGDEVVIFGDLVNFHGNTKEMTQGNYIYTLNGQGTDPGTGPEPGNAKGSGTLEDPYNPAAAAAAVEGFTWTSNTEYQSTDPVYVKGKISKIADKGTFTEGGNYGNASFYIADAEDGTGEFYVFRTYYLGNRKFEEGDTDIKVGDEVVVYGKLMNYRGNTPETVAGESYLYTLNGQGDTGLKFSVTPSVLNVAASATSAVIEVKGNVEWNAACDNDAFTLDKTSGTGDGTVTVSFDANTTDAERVANITIATAAEVATKSFTVKLTQAKPSDGSGVTVVFVAGTDKTNSSEAGHEVLTKDGITLDVSNGALFRTDNYRVYKGQTITVSSSVGDITKIEFTCTASGTAQYGPGNFHTETGTYTFEDTQGVWTGTAASVVLSAVENQVRATKIVVTVGEGGSGENPGGEPGGGDNPGTDVDAKEISVADFLKADESSTQPYQLTGTVAPHKGSINTTYGNFDLTDDSGSVYVYGLTATNLGYGATNDKSFSTLGINEGDNITIIGYRGSYNGDPEVVYAYFVKKNSGETPDDPGTPDDPDTPGEPGDPAVADVVDLAAMGYTNGEALDGVTTSGSFANITWASNGNSNGPKYYNSGAAVRVYPGNGFTVSIPEPAASSSRRMAPGDTPSKITAIVLTAKMADDRIVTLTPDTGTLSSNYVWTGSATSVTFNAGGNGGNIRISRIAVYYDNVEPDVAPGDDPVNPGTPDEKDPIAVTVEEFLAAPESSDQPYMLTGEIYNLVNTTYGNFDLVDATGSVLVYGLTSTNLGYGATSDRSFSSIGVGEGDNITIIGYRTSYNGTDEVGSAYFVSRNSSGSVEWDNTYDIVQPPITTTVAGFLNTRPSKFQPYTINATIKQVNDAAKGVVVINDGTGDLVVDGITSTKREYGDFNIANFNLLGLGEGDDITVTGYHDQKMNLTFMSYAYSSGSVPPLSLGQIITAADGTEFFTVGDIYVGAISSRGFIAVDNSDAVLLYNPKGSYALGDMVSFDGTKTTYNNLPEVTGANVTVFSSDNEVPYPEIKDITASLDSYSSSKAEYIQIRGKLVVSGNYYNIVVDGATRQGSIYYPHSSMNAAGFNGKSIVVKGYYNGLTSAGKYVNIVASSIELDSSIKIFDVSTASLNVSADEGGTSFDISANVPWTVALQSDPDGMVSSFSPASGEEDATVAINYGENTGSSQRTATFVVSTTAAGVDTPSYTVTLTQSAPASGVEVTVTFIAGTDKTSNAAGHDSITKDGVTLDVSNGILSRTDNYRIYKNANITISSTLGNITKVVFTCTSSNPANGFSTPSMGSWDSSSGTWTGNESSVVLTASNKQVQATKIEVTVAASSGGTPVPFAFKTYANMATLSSDGNTLTYDGDALTLNILKGSSSEALFQSTEQLPAKCMVGNTFVLTAPGNISELFIDMGDTFNATAAAAVAAQITQGTASVDADNAGISVTGIGSSVFTISNSPAEFSFYDLHGQYLN